MVDVSPTLSPGAKYFPSYLQCMLKISSQLPEMEGVPLTKARNMVVEALEEVEEVCSMYCYKVQEGYGYRVCVKVSISTGK